MNTVAFGRRCIPAGCVARRLHTPGMRAPRALPGGRLGAQADTSIPERTLRSDDANGRKVLAVPARVAREQIEAGDCRMGADVEVWHWRPALSSSATVFLIGMTGQETCCPRQVHTAAILGRQRRVK